MTCEGSWGGGYASRLLTSSLPSSTASLCPSVLGSDKRQNQKGLWPPAGIVGGSAQPRRKGEAPVSECSSTSQSDGADMQGVLRSQALASGHRYGKGTQGELRENGDDL